MSQQKAVPEAKNGLAKFKNGKIATLMDETKEKKTLFKIHLFNPTNSNFIHLYANNFLF